MPEKKVMLLNHGLASGGTDTFVLNTSKGLINDNYDVSIIMAVDSGDEAQFREADAIKFGAKVLRTNDLGSPKLVFRHCLNLYKILKTEKPDVFHANMDLFNGFNMLTARLASVPVRVCHSHTSESQYEASTGKHFTVNIYRKIMRWLLWRFSNRRVGCSIEAMNYLFTDKWKKDTSSYVLYNGIDLQKFNVAVDRTKVLHSMGLSTDVKYIIAVGRLSRTKNPFFAVKIMQELCKKRDDIELIWVGSGELEKEVKASIEESMLNDKIHMIGICKNVHEILKCGTVFVLPSLFEGLPISLIEAQAADLECGVSDAVSKQADMGKCKFLPIDKGTECWVKYIEDVVDSKIKTEKNEEMIKQFDIEYMIKRIEKIYETV